MEKTFDYIIAGGGSAGCTLASRLCENKDIKVLINADNNSKVEDYGDEPIFLSSRLRNIPIAVGANKFNAALELIKKNLKIISSEKEFYCVVLSCIIMKN